MEELIKIINGFKGKRMLVIGDLMLDKYIWGDVSRISPEAPVQVVNVKGERFFPGGAANAANNVASLGGRVDILGIIGDDEAGKILISEMEKKGINIGLKIVNNNIPTTQKIRIIARNQQLLRMDQEEVNKLNSETEEKILKYIKTKILEINAILISDYNKGMITENLIKNIIEQSNNKIIIVNPKPCNKEFYKNVTLISLNHLEASEMSGIKEESEEGLIKIGNKLIENLNCNILITRGEKGMCLFEKNGSTTNIPTQAKEVYDVTGAGDTVCGALTLAMAAGASMKQAAMIANYAAGIVVGKFGTATVTAEEVKNAIKEDFENELKTKQ